MTDHRQPAEQQAPPPNIPVVTTPADAPTIYADIMYHVTWMYGVARLTFVANYGDQRPGEEGYWEGKHVVNLAMPQASVVAMRDYLTKIIDYWAAEGSGTSS